MQVLYRKCDMVLVGAGDSFGGIGDGFGVVEIDDVSALVDDDGAVLEGKTLEDIKGATGLLKAALSAQIDARTTASLLAGGGGESFVQERLAQGWADKLTLDNLTLAELVAWEATS